MIIKRCIRKVLSKEFYEKLHDKKMLIINRIHKHYSIEKIKKYVSKEYKAHIEKEMNWENPTSYTEKINYAKVFKGNELKTKLSDKYLVREWVKSKIGEDYLVPLLGVYDSFDEIDFDKLPEKFVIKCNHDSGSTIICNDKTKLNLKKLKAKYDYHMKINFAYAGFEMHYKDIKPKIMIEKYLGENINDYKFLCFDSKPYYCWVDFNRYTNHKRNIYDLKWNLQPFNQMTYGNGENIPKPKQFDHMLELSKKLSKDFDHVRVDFYDVDGKIYFGEMTFTNGNGMEIIQPYEYDLELGKLWNLEK